MRPLSYPMGRLVTGRLNPCRQPLVADAPLARHPMRDVVGFSVLAYLLAWVVWAPGIVPRLGTPCGRIG
jgi:hypothetical protein